MATLGRCRAVYEGGGGWGWCEVDRVEGEKDGDLACVEGILSECLLDGVAMQEDIRGMHGISERKSVSSGVPVSR